MSHSSPGARELVERIQAKVNVFRESGNKHQQICNLDPVKYVWNRFLKTEEGKECLQNVGATPGSFFGPSRATINIVLVTHIYSTWY